MFECLTELILKPDELISAFVKFDNSGLIRRKHCLLFLIAYYFLNNSKIHFSFEANGYPRVISHFTADIQI